MIKKLVAGVAAVGLVVLAGVVVAEETNRFGVEWDAEAVASMSREDRLVYQKQYKAALEEAARNAGALPAAEKVVQQRREKPAGVQKIAMTSISYHSGALSAATQNGLSVGNRFDTALTTMGGLGPVEMSGSITMLSADLASAVGNVFFSIYDQLSGATANQITSMSTPMVTGANNITLPTAFNYVGTSFLAGIWNFPSASVLVNVATGTVSSQGFHGMSIEDAPAGEDFNALTMTNAAVGVSGNVATPVELMSFQID